MTDIGFPEQVGLKEFEADRIAAKGAWQAEISLAHEAPDVQAAVRAADIAYHRSLVASGLRNGVRFDGSQHALRDLGAA